MDQRSNLPAAPGSRRALAAWAATVGPAALALLAGCSAPAPVQQTVQCSAAAAARPAGPGPALVSQEYGTTATPIPTNAVLFTDEALAQAVSVQALFAARTEAGTVQVSARLVSCLDRPLLLRARTAFLHKSTAPAEAPSAWQPVHLPPRATTLYAESSLGRDEVALYLIELAPATP